MLGNLINLSVLLSYLILKIIRLEEGRERQEQAGVRAGPDVDEGGNSGVLVVDEPRPDVWGKRPGAGDELNAKLTNASISSMNFWMNFGLCK